MRFLTFVDVHENKKLRRQLVKRAGEKDVDFVLSAGDFSTFGRGLQAFLDDFRICHKRLYLIPGNHEEKFDFEELLRPFPHCFNLHQQAIEMGDYVFLGYGGNGFSQHDEHFRRVAREWYGRYKGKKIVLVTHAPPFGTTLDKLPSGHVGHIDYRRFIERIEPKIVISGHLHETAGAMDTIGKTKLINPGWEGMVVELK